MELNKVGTDSVQQGQVSEQTATQKSQAAKENQAGSKAQDAQKSGQAKSAVKWSADSQLLSEGLELAKAAPDVRSDKIAQIKQAIQNGTYKADSKKIADRMIQASLEDDLASRNG
jgi:negative regulator of flagellin synthesis FlgM